MLSTHWFSYASWLLGSHVCVLTMLPGPCCLVFMLFRPQVLIRSLCHQVASFFISCSQGTLVAVARCCAQSRYSLVPSSLICSTVYSLSFPRSLGSHVDPALCFLILEFLGLCVAWSPDPYIAQSPNPAWLLCFQVPKSPLLL